MKTRIVSLAITRLTISHRVRSTLKQVLSACLFVATSYLVAQAQTLKLVEPEIPDGITFLAPGVVDLKFEVSGDVKQVRILVRTDDDNSKMVINVQPPMLQYSPSVNLLKGRNTIELLAFKEGQDKASVRTSFVVICSGKKCGTGESGGSAGGSGGSGGGGGTAQADSKGLIGIEQPEGSPTVNSPTIDAYLKITKADSKEIKNLQYEIFKDGKTVFTGPKVAVTYSGSDPAKVQMNVRIAEGDNIIRFFDPDDAGEPKRQAFKTVKCKGDNCAGDFLIAEFPSTSQNSRVIAGFEQAGASSASSETKPFLDFFFYTPFLFSKCGARPASLDKAIGTLTDPEKEANDKYRTCVARRDPWVAAWGQIRFTTTPDQIAAVGVLPSNFVNQLGRANNTVDLVQSFDFLVGLDFRLFAANGSFLSLAPGIRQRTIFSFAGGGGAINPLTARRELAQIFKIPGQDGPQREEFVSRYGTPPQGKEFVGLVPLDRDRFLRQWYMGLRLKTLYCDNEECSRFRNNFPAIVDVMFGQNEAVTGGSLFYTTVDPTDPTKIIKKRSFVLRFDAFYPFPLRQANFLYFYGSALMKIGAGGVRIQNPLFLDTAPGDVLITDSRVFIPESDRQKMFQPSRDYYKVGIGINLTELFNRNKRPQ